VWVLFSSATADSTADSVILAGLGMIVSLHAEKTIKNNELVSFQRLIPGALRISGIHLWVLL
jgi:hypothetical protein